MTHAATHAQAYDGARQLRQKFKDLLWQRGLSVREASIAIGRNHSCVYRFVKLAKPRALDARDTGKLAHLLGCEAEELRHRTVPRRKRWTRKPQPKPPVSAPSMAGVPEMEVEAAAGPGALNQEFAAEKARWQLPEAMSRYEGGADPAALCRVRNIEVRQVGQCSGASVNEAIRLILIYMGASRWQGRFGMSGGQVAVLYPACWYRTSFLLALMESADPNLICRPSSTLRSRFRFGGSRSDLFAITPCRTLRNLSEATSCAGSFLPSSSAITPAG